ncbi:dihydrolipoyllysine-residue succinyltransferase component of 2-oxoglutarate dehydrogenase complex 2, mitochondrial-like [Rosa rugosa]|uniref:dihydrolipoyllysine-residue succinyltransferase component of 2-oxoglutarate dehydrogenase complex 2, mitochondrial-like n=1 Tax=Rosa rugosa TaxID=74645 RepID=UPI002B416773|nr:dihydrolipoyllysine-residue succinyltransferase component of 2-oxoglutarate dehydrogenase complex 2, mitochondrial-like [Rosa rugosa]XP_062006711.1 dihydrolipoyllysine-residue succinyltransferase component of 2-oxoglutarate dehydrogenase complex 2, mitochondrial-like [Rosa rugosa]XP_062006712.1 dihydrolipoyllysine-residue succinyltransferase component of 2-oxoglutarate dehydrogenase complex 2, mitochondrial-like [Rosa rugosa]XP_062006713.1 dihydrolipoyllysine-residue succinyltransferase compo
MIDVASPESGVIVKFVANEGDTVEPSTTIVVILKSSEGVSHVGPSEKTLEKDVPQPASPVETISKNQTSKVVITPVTEKPKAPSPKPSAQEPQLPPKERERRASLLRTNLIKLRCDFKDASVEKHGVNLGLMSRFIKGLVVPVIRNGDKMNCGEIEKEINSLAKKANEGRLSIDDMARGSFTISNGGFYGSLISTLIIDPPQV